MRYEVTSCFINFEQIISKTSLTLPLEVTAPHIENESYWKQVCENKFKNCRPEEHGGSYKQAFIEKYLQQRLENHKV